MTSPIGLIKQGIEEQNWAKIVSGYNSLTGEQMVVPNVQETDFGIRRQLEAILHTTQSCLDRLGQPNQDDPEPEQPQRLPVKTPPPRTEEDRIREVHKGGRKSPPDFTIIHPGPKEKRGRLARVEPFVKGKFVNNFIDDPAMAQADAELDRKLQRGMRPAPRRSPPPMVMATCFHCEKTELVDALLAGNKLGSSEDTDDESHYVCDRCLSSNGGRDA